MLRVRETRLVIARPVAYPCDVTNDAKRWADSWARAARALAALDPAIDTKAAVQQLMPVFRLAREATPKTTTSGLVAMRRLLDRKNG